MFFIEAEHLFNSRLMLMIKKINVEFLAVISQIVKAIFRRGSNGMSDFVVVGRCKSVAAF